MRWEIKYYPPSGERYSPKDFIQSITNPGEVNIIGRRLETISQLETYEWPTKWIKSIEGIYQLTAGDHRLYFDLDGNRIIIVCYVCRKVRQKALKSDLVHAKNNLANYYKLKESESK
ncbi:MAG: hypothetical protein JXB15_09595 [Anaerolineales bacterium]|nr:hypothetical protein [Anaerolineales bacterium]